LPDNHTRNQLDNLHGKLLKTMRDKLQSAHLETQTAELNQRLNDLSRRAKCVLKQTRVQLDQLQKQKMKRREAKKMKRKKAKKAQYDADQLKAAKAQDEADQLKAAKAQDDADQLKAAKAQDDADQLKAAKAQDDAVDRAEELEEAKYRAEMEWQMNLLVDEIEFERLHQTHLKEAVDVLKKVYGEGQTESRVEKMQKRIAHIYRRLLKELRKKIIEDMMNKARMDLTFQVKQYRKSFRRKLATFDNVPPEDYPDEVRLAHVACKTAVFRNFATKHPKKCHLFWNQLRKRIDKKYNSIVSQLLEGT
jgi:membrane protein involved in colicin uptake